MLDKLRKEALEYHSRARKGKIELRPTKPCASSRDLSLAYSPGVAAPCEEISKDESKVYEYTSKGNLVGVITNGSAVLGLGNIGPLGAKPVMEGKGVLFKKFADIDVFDIELNAKTPDEVIQACKALEPTFGGINLEDIKAPECFYIEEQLRKELNIPVFHDDQHGTAVITTAAFKNALEIIKKDPEKMKIVFSGGGAAALACANLIISLGVKKENIILCDSKGVIHTGRKDINEYKARFVIDTKLRTLEEAMEGADAFIGVSVQGLVTQKMVKSMEKDPIVFAMANPDPEILPTDVLKVCPDAITATGRSDFPNQVNNVLCFPFIFRGALDVQARAINEEMKIAAADSLAKLAKESVPEFVRNAYGGTRFHFGKEYLIPKPFDPRVLSWVAPAVAKAAMDSGVARSKIKSIPVYKELLERRMGSQFMMFMKFLKSSIQKYINQTKSLPKVVFPEGDDPRILQAIQIIIEEKIAHPIVLGSKEKIMAKIKELKIQDLENLEVINPKTSKKTKGYAEIYRKKRERKGLTEEKAQREMMNGSYYGPMMVETGDADSVMNGVSLSYPNAIRPMVYTVGAKPSQRLAGVYVISCKDRVFLLADTTVNIESSSEELANIAIETSKLARVLLRTEPKVAMLSYSNFGSAPSKSSAKVKKAVEIAKSLDPDLIIDGEMQVNVAIEPETAEGLFPFSKIKGDANVLIFPELNSANITYRLLHYIGEEEAIGPILIGMNKPVTVLQQSCSVQSIVNMAMVTVLKVQMKNNENAKQKNH